jgi:adenosylmethionine-8-amino-7-oxononanoate aminotransferase
MTDHLWLHFAKHGPGIRPPIITRGDGVMIFDDAGKSYLDGVSGLFVVQVGHGRAELAEAAARQAGTLAYFPLWGYATPPAIELANRIAGYAPGDLNRVFFTSGGGEAVESAWKLAKQYFKLTGKPGKYKVISRAVAYHGTPQGALAITGLPAYKTPFEPLTPGGFRVPNTNFYRRGDRVRRTRHRCRGVPRTGAERGRLHPATTGLFRPGPGDLRSLRRPAGIRRGDLRVGADRLNVRLL